jgi:hypothetical protein
MSLEFLPPTEIEKQRTAWFAERTKPGMTTDEYWQLNEDIYQFFPRTDEERRQKAEALANIPEFVL